MLHKLSSVLPRSTLFAATVNLDLARHDGVHALHAQVRNAEAAGAVAAIVYDDVAESLIIMSKPRCARQTFRFCEIWFVNFGVVSLDASKLSDLQDLRELGMGR